MVPFKVTSKLLLCCLFDNFTTGGKEGDGSVIEKVTPVTTLVEWFD